MASSSDGRGAEQASLTPRQGVIAALKREFGDRLAFWGTVGAQSTMPHGTPAQVRAVVQERIETVGKGGGLLISPAHTLEPDVPWENLVALIEAVEEFGEY